MHFCVKCDNMYYMKLKDGDTNKLIYYCRNCQHEADDLTESDVCVLKTQVKRSEEKYTHVINEYTKEDPPSLELRLLSVLIKTVQVIKVKWKER